MKNIIYLNGIYNIHSKNRNKFASFLIHCKDAINDISTNQQKQNKYKSKLYARIPKIICAHTQIIEIFFNYIQNHYKNER